MRLLNVGSGPAHGQDKLPPRFCEWEIVRMDINPDVKPDIISDALDMSMIETDVYDAIYNSHMLEHSYLSDVPKVLKNFYRVLKHGGHIYIKVPDVKAVINAVALGLCEWTGELYRSPAGSIRPYDVFYGYTPYIEKGNVFYAHKIGFDEKLLRIKLREAGFRHIAIGTKDYELTAEGYK